MGRNNYFSHDSNARNSEKLIRVRMRHKAAGYGVYFMILERLRDEPDYMSVVDYNLIAYDLREDAALIKSVVEDFGLFVFTEDGKYFYSEGFSHRMSIKDEISTVRSAAGKKGATRRWEKPEKGKTCKENGKVIANAITNDAKVITNDKNFDSKESKVKERKVNPTPPIIPPMGEKVEEGHNFILQKILADGKKRNLEGLSEAMAALGIPQNQQDEILYLSNYGLIGSPVWPLVQQCRDSARKKATDPSRIRLPGNYIIQMLKKSKNESA